MLKEGKGQVRYLIGDAMDIVRSLPDGGIDLVATSPPFLALRDYGVDGQWGAEPTPAAFLDHLLELTIELRRVLAPHGSIAIELGDTYSTNDASTVPPPRPDTGRCAPCASLHRAEPDRAEPPQPTPERPQEMTNIDSQENARAARIAVRRRAAETDARYDDWAQLNQLRRAHRPLACPRVVAGKRHTKTKPWERCRCESFGGTGPLDHARLWWTTQGRHHVLTGEPYDLHPTDLADLRTWCTELGLLVTVPDYPSPWYPGSTTLVVVHPPTFNVFLGAITPQSPTTNHPHPK
jgi:hypothetical protein